MLRSASLLILSFALAIPAQAGFEEGSAAYQRVDYATALREWLPSRLIAHRPEHSPPSTPIRTIRQLTCLGHCRAARDRGGRLPVA